MESRRNNLAEWLESIPTFLEQLERHHHTDDLVLANQLYGRCEDYLALLQSVYTRAEEETLNVQVQTDTADHDVIQLMENIQALIALITTHSVHYRDWVLQLVDTEADTPCALQAPQLVHHRGRGRPAYHIPQSQIEALLELRFTYEKIARMLNISTRTLQRRRMQYGLPSGRWYTDISDQELEDTIKGILEVWFLLVTYHYYWVGFN